MLCFEKIRHDFFLLLGVLRTEVSLHKALFGASFDYLGEFSVALVELGNLHLLPLQLGGKDQALLRPRFVDCVGVAESVASEDVCCSIPRSLHHAALLLRFVFADEFRSGEVEDVDLRVGLEGNPQGGVIQESGRAIHGKGRIESWNWFTVSTFVCCYLALLHDLSLVDEARTLNTYSILTRIVLDEVQHLAKTTQLPQFLKKGLSVFEFIGGLGEKGTD